MNIKFDAKCPEEVENSIRSYLEEFYPVVQRWIDKFTVEFEVENEEGFEAAIIVRREYKNARLFVTSEYLLLDEKERMHTIAHELAHILTSPLRVETRRIAEVWVPMETIEYVRGVFDNVEEQVVDDLAKFLVTCLTAKRESGKLSTPGITFTGAYGQIIDADKHGRSD